jgi:hypothetical protein
MAEGKSEALIDELEERRKLYVGLTKKLKEKQAELV